MKTGITLRLHESNLFERYGNNIYKKIKAFGYDCIDFNIGNPSTKYYTATHEEAKSFILMDKQLIDDAGLAVSQVHGPSFWPPACQTELDYTARMDKIKFSMELTALLGCKYWVIHPIMQYGGNDLVSGDTQKTWDINIKLMSELLQKAKEQGVVICLENMPLPEFSIANYEQILKFVQTMNSDNFKICLDAGHTTAFGYNTLSQAVRTLGNNIRVLHVHDNMHGRDMHLMPYCGKIDWDSFARALADIKFDGVLSLETRPNEALSNELFEDMSIMQAKIARSIADKVDTYMKD